MKNNLSDKTKLLHLSLWLGASEKWTEPYLNTVREYWRLQRSQRPRALAGLLALPNDRQMWCRSLEWM